MIAMARSHRAAYFDPIAVRADCRICKTSPPAREEWGCDKATDEPIFEIPCPRCFGAARRCSRCGGSGREGIHRCPNATLSASVRTALWLYGLYPGNLPQPGTILDQTAHFIATVRILQYADAEIERVKK